MIKNNYSVNNISKINIIEGDVDIEDIDDYLENIDDYLEDNIKVVYGIENIDDDILDLVNDKYPNLDIEIYKDLYEIITKIKKIYKMYNKESSLKLLIDLYQKLIDNIGYKNVYALIKNKNDIYVSDSKIYDLNINHKINPILQIKINKLKNKIKNNKLNRDLKFKINNKSYNFSSNTLNENIINNKKKKKIYTKSDYFEKYKNRISDEDIKELEKVIKNKELKNKEFWKKHEKEKIISKDKINSLFKDDPVIDFDNELFYKKYMNKHYTNIYKDIINDLNSLEKECINLKIIETYYNKLKENIIITSFFKNETNKISKLFTDYENNRVNEYKVLLEIGNLFINNELTKEEIKEINSINQNSRPARLLKQSQRVYILEEFVNIKNIALAGISNWLRDTSDENFNILLTFFYNKQKTDNIPYLENLFT